jgi:hypothetical protein
VDYENLDSKFMIFSYFGTKAEIEEGLPIPDKY